MAAVRCAARRLGGSLLQRTQAEEGRRLAPSRLVRSRGLSSEHAGEIPKKEELSDLQSKLQRKKGVLRVVLDEYEKLPRQDKLRLHSGVVRGAAKLTFFCMITAVAFGGDSLKGVEAKIEKPVKARSKENQ